MTLEYLQNYWWTLIAVLGGILVFLLMVQGGQSMLFGLGRNENYRDRIIGAMGSKWELTFTTLVTFGGAFFASFPLYYSTCFGGAYWLWILILFSFVLQAVSYEYRRKHGNIYGTRTYDCFLWINGSIGTILLGEAVGMYFFGGDFTVNRANILSAGSPVISQWGPLHGFEVIFSWKYLLLGFTVLFLARMQACLYLMNRCPDDMKLFKTLKQRAFVNGGIFVVLFLGFTSVLWTATGYTVESAGGHTVAVTETKFKYFFNMFENWWEILTWAVGVVMVLYGLLRSVFAKHFTGGIWFSGIGTFLVIVALFWAVGYGDTAFLPSLTDPMSSLTIRNASSSEFTLKAMSYASIFIPFVLAYIWYVWRQMDKKDKTDN